MTQEIPAVGRNQPCPCGSGLRYKQCHGLLAESPAEETLAPQAAAQRGFEAHKRNDLDSAERYYRQALAQASDHHGATHYLGVVLHQRNRSEEAMPFLDRAIALAPDEPEYHNNRGVALVALQRNDEGIASHRRALALKPQHAGAWNNLGLALQAAGDVDAAVATFREGLSVAPDYPQLHWNLSLALLLLGDYAQGWREYEWRLKCPELYAHHPQYRGPRWTGDDPAGRTLLLTGEQGLGDVLQTLRFAREVADRGARVLVAVHTPLRELAATTPGVTEAFAEYANLPPYDAHISLMSLPGLLGVDVLNVPGRVPYLSPSASQLRDVREALRAHRGTLNIGIAWSGSAGNTHNFKRSMSLALLAPLLDVPGTRWFSLKWDRETLTPGDAPYGEKLVALPARNSFDGLAALMSELDLVVTVDTSIAHLAGALGRPLWVMLAHVPDWRWMLTRTDSPWYPSARLFRQHAPGDWSRPLREMDVALRALLVSRAATVS